MITYATPADVADRWRPLSDSENTTVETLLDDAQDMLLVRWPDLEDRVRSGSLREQTVKRVLCGMVKRAMLAASADGVAQQSQNVGPFSTSATYANPTAKLYLTADDIAAFDGQRGGVRMGWLA